MWLEQYSQKIEKSKLTRQERRQMISAANPVFVLRNYLAQQAIDAAEQGDYALLHELSEALKQPYSHQEKFQKFIQKRPDWAKSKAGCSMLSCSS